MYTIRASINTHSRAQALASEQIFCKGNTYTKIDINCE